MAYHPALSGVVGDLDACEFYSGQGAFNQVCRERGAVIDFGRVCLLYPFAEPFLAGMAVRSFDCELGMQLGVSKASGFLLLSLRTKS